MIEEVEEFCANFESNRFLYICPLRKAEVRGYDAGTMKKLTVRVSETSEWAGSEGVRQEIGVCTVRPGFTRVLGDHSAHEIGHIVVGPFPDKRDIPSLADLDRQTARHARDTVEVPPLCQALRRAAERPIERDRPVVADHEIVRDVVLRKRPAQPEVREVDPLVKSRGIVNALGERIGGEERQVRRLSLHGNLRGIVIGVGNVGRNGVALAKASLVSGVGAMVNPETTVGSQALTSAVEYGAIGTCNHPVSSTWPTGVTSRRDSRRIH